MKRLILVIAILFASTILAGCNAKLASDEEANKIAQLFLDSVNRGDFDKAFELAGEDFFKFRTKETWTAYYEAVNATLGPVVSLNQYNKLIDDRYSGTFYVYQFKVNREKGSSKDMITLVQPVIDDHGVKIVAHKIDSKDLGEIDKRF